MLLDNKITDILSRENSIFEDNINSFISYLQNTGIARTKVMIQIDILFHLLNQQFSYDYINRELYKKLNHLLEVTTPLSKTQYPLEVTPVTTPTIVTSVASLAFGNVTIGQSKTMVLTVTGTDLNTLLSVTCPSKLTISVDNTSSFKTSIGFVPLDDDIIKVIYVKYTPTIAGADSGNIVVSSTGATNAIVSFTGTGVTP